MCVMGSLKGEVMGRKEDGQRLRLRQAVRCINRVTLTKVSTEVLRGTLEYLLIMCCRVC